MDDLEAKMAEALRGKFFMDPTYEQFGVPNPLQLEILRVQRTFVDKVPKKPPPLPPKPVAKPNDSGFTFDYLLDVVCHVHGVDKALIKGSSRVKAAMVAKHHYRWALTRYYPGLSVAEIGRRIGHDHTTVLHSLDSFKKIMGKYADEIKAVDEAMEYK